MELADDIARTLLDGFDKHYRLFRETSARAKKRYEEADWAGAAKASRERITMYDQRVDEAVASLRERFPNAGDESALWHPIKLAFIGLLYDHKQPELAETFYNSVTRRFLGRRYYDNEVIFRRPSVSTEHLDGSEPTYDCHYAPGKADLPTAIRQALESFALDNRFQNIHRDVGYLIRAVEEQFPGEWELAPNFQLQVLRSLFFRNRAAYVVGRVINGHTTIPFVVPLLQDEHAQIYVDTVILKPVELGRLFSLGRVYFMVDMEVPSAYVSFLESVVPNRPRAELYTLLGLQKQGKTVFFRDLEDHVKHSSDAFVLAAGTRGMVMLVFTLPSFPYVFKLIRDWFEPPKDADRKHVEERYDYVKSIDRVGRMADTLEFAHVAFPKARFDPGLLKELHRLCPSSIEDDGKTIVVDHLYTERRLVPLDVYLRSADEEHLREGLREFGNAIKDLATVDLFPGDLLTKNFGVTRFGRVVFYDYDELTTVTELKFRTMPTPRDDDEEHASEAWFAVGPDDVFPEQFPTFLFPHGRAREIFMELHGDLATARWWNDIQEKLRTDTAEDVFAYPREKRFSVRWNRP